VSIRGSEQFGAIAADLELIKGRIRTEFRPLLEEFGRDVTEDAKNRIEARRHSPTHIPSYPSSITFDLKDTSDGLNLEAGPDKDLPQGPLGNIFEFGTSKTAPIPHLGPAYEAHLEPFLGKIEASAGSLVLP
jgi:hypothetical protein